MTPENDKTLRGLFHSHKIGYDEWNDRRDYRQKYEKEFFLHRNNTTLAEHILGFMSFSISSRPKKTIVHDEYADPDQEEFNEHSNILKFFPESEKIQKYMWMMSFGMGRDVDGNFTQCDCCGRHLNYLNSSPYGMCDICVDDHNGGMPNYEI